MLGDLCLSGVCCGDIAYDGNGAWTMHTACFPGRTAVTGAGADPTKLTSSILLFLAGNDFRCGDATQFLPSTSWTAIGDWIKAGGRMWLQTEYGKQDTPDTDGCLVNHVNVNNFLAAIGTAIRWKGAIYDDGAACDTSTASCTPGAAAIAAGSALQIAVMGEITGGTSVWLGGKHGKVVVACEKLNQGFIFVTGDSNISGGCGYTGNYAFFNKLLTADSGSII